MSLSVALTADVAKAPIIVELGLSDQSVQHVHHLMGLWLVERHVVCHLISIWLPPKARHNVPNVLEHVLDVHDAAVSSRSGTKRRTMLGVE